MSKGPARPEYYRHRKLIQRYGIPQSEWFRLFELQKFKCAICNRTTPGGAWHTDHDHDTKKVRGILCQPCNMALGRYQKEKHIHPKFDEYLEKHSND